MKYYRTKKRIEKLTPEERVEVARIFGVSVENLACITPWRWDYDMKSDKFKSFRRQQIRKEILEYEKIGEKYESGELPLEQQQKLNYKFDNWTKQSYDEIDVYIKNIRKVSPKVAELRKVINKNLETSRYDKYIQVRETKYKPKALVIEKDNTIYVVQKYFAINYHNLKHMEIRGLFRYVKTSFICQKDLCGETQEPYGSKEWLESRIPKSDREMFKGKRFIFYLYIHYPQTGRTSMLSADHFLDKLGPFKIDQDE